MKRSEKLLYENQKKTKKNVLSSKEGTKEEQTVADGKKKSEGT